MTEPAGFSQHTIQAFLAELASKSPAPGGGAAAPVCAAVASALANMVVAYSVGRKSLAEHQATHEAARDELFAAAKRFLALAERDATAYARLNELQRLDKADPRRADLPEALRQAVDAPLGVIRLCVEVLELGERLAPVSNPWLLSDMGIAAVLLEACARASRWNVEVNAKAMIDEGLPGSDAVREADDLLARAAALLPRVERACRAG